MHVSVTCNVHSYDNNKALEQKVPVFMVSQSLQKNTVISRLTSAYGRLSCSSNIHEGQSVNA